MTPTLLRPALLALGIGLLPLGQALAATSLYLEIPHVAGGSADPLHPDAIDLTSFHWAASVAFARNAAGKRFFNLPSIEDVRWAQRSAGAGTLPLFSAGTTGTVVPNASFLVVDGTAAGRKPSLVLQARDAVVSGLVVGGSSGSNGINLQSAFNTADLSLRFDPGALGSAEAALETRFTQSTFVSPPTISGPTVRDPVAGTSGPPTQAGLYLRLGGANNRIAGDTVTLGYEHWIAIDSYGLAASAPVGGTPSIDTLSWTQQLDATAPVVLRNLLGSIGLGRATLERVVVGNNGRPATVMQLAMNDVVFTSFALDAQADAAAKVSASLSFASYSQSSWVPMADGSRIGPFTAGYDVDRGTRIPGALAQAVAGFGPGNLDGTAAPIPEPQGWALLLVGLAAVLARARRSPAAA